MADVAHADVSPGLLACVHCGLCQQACPTYVEGGVEADSPRGRIALMRSVEEETIAIADPAVREHLDACLGCRACETACPSGVPYGEVLERMRPKIEATRSRGERWMREGLARLLTSRVGVMPLRAVARLPLRRWLADRTGSEWVAFAAALSPRTIPGGQVPPAPPVTQGERGTALVQIGCVTDALFADLGQSAAALLRLAGWNVVMPPAQPCCGALAAHLGVEKLAHKQEAALARLFGATPADVVVTTAAGCGAHIDAPNARDALSVLADGGLPAPRRRIDMRVAIHDPCHLVHGQGVATEVRELLGRIDGLTLIPLAESDMCCGSAGTYNLTQRDMAARLLERKLSHCEASGADVVVAANPGCLLQMRAGAIRRGSKIDVCHPLDLLAAAYGVA